MSIPRQARAVASHPLLLAILLASCLLVVFVSSALADALTETRPITSLPVAPPQALEAAVGPSCRYGAAASESRPVPVARHSFRGLVCQLRNQRWRWQLG